MRQRKQRKIDMNLQRQNARRLHHDYRVGEEVLLLQKDLQGKLEPKATGPFRITRVHTNGTVSVNRGAYVERLNIRRIKPYRR